MDLKAADDKHEAATDLVKAIDMNLKARGQAEHDAALKVFMDALDYYVERQNQGWVR